MAEPRDAAMADIWTAMEAHRAALTAIARRRLPSAADAEDAVQEAFVRAAARSDELRHETLGAWLTRVVVNICNDFHRRREQPAADPQPDCRVQLGHEDAICDRAEARWLAGQLAALPERQRQALLLRAAGNPVADIAAAMGVPPKAGEALLKRARTAMRVRLSTVAAVTWTIARLIRGRRLARAAKLGGAVTALSLVMTSIVLAHRPSTFAPPRAHALKLLTPAVESSARNPSAQPSEPVKPSAQGAIGQARVSSTSHFLVPGQRVTAGHVLVVSGGGVKVGPQESFWRSAERCLQSFTLSLSHIGCPSQQGAEARRAPR